MPGGVMEAQGGARGGDGVAIVSIGPNSSDEDKARCEDGDRNCGGNRWPREETLALIKIRSEMDAAFRGSSPKAPLWEEVSRKLAELDYHRSAKKCKEKFENIYKYHKRTKEGRAGKQDSKTYKFFEQLEALQHNNSSSVPPPPRTPQKPQTPVSPPPFWISSTAGQITFPVMTNPTNIIAHDTTIRNPTVPSAQQVNAHLFSSSPSSSTASDEDQLERRESKKRKWKDFFRKLTTDVIAKQEDLQKKFLETIDKREHERVAREEAWRMQEMERMNRQHEMLVQEQSAIAAKNAAIIAFLQKMSGSEPQNTVQSNDGSHVQEQQPRQPPMVHWNVPKGENGVNSTVVTVTTSSSRWPKAEVLALIKLKTDLDNKYNENVPKGPLWEEISGGMQRLGYNRSAKKCKEKWENINKYFKKMKDSNKKRSEDSKTCPYFHELDALYREKNKNNTEILSFNNNGNNCGQNTIGGSMEAIMVRPEQQWPPQEELQRVMSAMEDNGSEENEEDEEITEEEDHQNRYEVKGTNCHGVQVENVD